MQLRSGDVVLRSFSHSHTRDVFEIRNHASVRSGLRDSKPISWEGHCEWVRENLVDQRRVHLFLVCTREQPVGIALLRNFREESAEIGVMVVEAGRRQLVCYKAAHLLGYYGFEVLGLAKLLSYVPLHNEHALAFNLHCGLEKTGTQSDVYHVLRITREQSRAHLTHTHYQSRYGIEVLDED